ncbi:hypothetical protein AR688_15755 [Rheinheimera sp. EpRS3]|nr:hypothetical protein AR688_15755 [Rheinheimera sp. EpRS3]
MLLLAVLNTVDLVVGTSKSAWLHRDLKNQFIELEKAFFRDERITQAELNEAKSIRLSIEALEPPIYRNLDLYCHNELVNSMHWDSEEDKLKNLVKIGWFRKRLRNYIRTVK